VPPHVDVWDPTSEGPWIVENLRQSDLDVREVDLVDLPLTKADLVLMAGDARGALGALKLLRDEGERGDVPVILLGVPDGMSHEGTGPAFGAEAVFVRPIELSPLLARCLALLEAASGQDVSRVQAPSPERTLQLSDPDDPHSSQVVSRTDDLPSGSWRPREPTMQLDDEDEEPGADPPEISKVTGRSSYVSEHPPPTTGSGRSRSDSSSSHISSYPGTGSHPGTSPPRREIPPERRASLSPWLSELLAAADRRVFPDRAPLALHLPAADDPPEVLVPSELFDTPSFHIDEGPLEDPIDAFTYVGGPAVPPPIASGTSDDAASTDGGATPMPSIRRVPTSADATRGPIRLEVTTRTELPPIETRMPNARGGDWPEDDTVLGRASPAGDRHGALGPGGALRLLWRVAALGLDAICELSLEDGTSVRMTFLAGELRAFDGPVALRVLDGLRRRGRATERPADEAGAEVALQKRVDAGRLGRFERDRLLREARERLLVEVVQADRATFALRRLDDTQPGRVLSRARMLRRPLRAALVEVAREALDAARVGELLGPERPGLALGPERESALIAAELTSELVELLVRLDGHRLDDFLAAAPTEPGLAGLLYALVAGDALVLTDPPDELVPGEREAVEELIRSAAARAADADYFSILGVEPEAGGGAIERAHQARRSELTAVPLVALGLDALEVAREEAVEALDEAYSVLRDAERRRAYARALVPRLSP